MSEYSSNLELAQAISARIGTEPIPFASVSGLCYQIYEELGGTRENYDDVYSILLDILPLTDLIDDTVTTTNKTWSSSKIQNELDNVSVNVEAGSGITIVNDVISANTGATVKNQITLSNGAPINALGIWENDVIPQGTSIQSVLEKLLNRELFPSAATKPSFSIASGALGLYEIGSSVTLVAPSTTKSNGSYNASFSSPAQPNVTGVTWSNETVSAPSIVSGFTGSGDTRTVEIGTNKATYTYSKTYSAPSNMPITNQNHPTQSTSKISTDGSDISAIWAADTVTKNGNVTATGVYACFNNINDSTLTDNANHKLSLTSGNEFIFIDVPSEEVTGKHFKFAFPADRSVTFKIRDLSGDYVPYSATYNVTAVTSFYNGIDYKVLVTTGDNQGSNTYKMILSKNLSE